MQNLSGIASGPLSVANNQLSTETGLKVDYEKYKLENGLEIILHQEHANPIVAVAILYHVGSSREKSGKTGFAHFFEHMLFQNSLKYYYLDNIHTLLLKKLLRYKDMSLWSSLTLIHHIRIFFEYY